MRMTAFAVLALLTAVGVVSGAEPSVRLASPHAIGVSYELTLRGQTITAANVAAHEVQHLWYASYAPMEYVQILLGVGTERFEVDPSNDVYFDGRYGFSPVVGLYGYTPSFVGESLRLTLGGRMVYLRSEDMHGFAYAGPIFDAECAILVHAGAFVDIETGVRVHVIGGSMSGEEVSGDFSNEEIVRGYLDLSLVHPCGTFATLKLDASPDVKLDWKDGPYEASVGFAVGAMLRTRRLVTPKEKTNPYFPEHDKLREQQEEMEKQLND